MTAQEIKSLVETMPELDTTPEKDDWRLTKYRGIEARHYKGKLTGPTWAEAAKLYERVLAGGREAVAAVIDLVGESDHGPAYKALYVLNGLCTHAARARSAKHRAAVVEALLAAIADARRPATVRAKLIRLLQGVGDAESAKALAGLLGDAELCDAAAQAMVALAGDAAEPSLRQGLGAAMSGSARRPKLAAVQATGAVRGAANPTALEAGAASSDEDLRLVSLWALARSGAPGAAKVILEAVASLEGYAGAKAVSAAFTLADTLAAAGRKGEAQAVLNRLRALRKGEEDAYIREAADRVLAELK